MSFKKEWVIIPSNQSVQAVRNEKKKEKKKRNWTKLLKFKFNEFNRLPTSVSERSIF